MAIRQSTGTKYSSNPVGVNIRAPGKGVGLAEFLEDWGLTAIRFSSHPLGVNVRPRKGIDFAYVRGAVVVLTVVFLLMIFIDDVWYFLGFMAGVAAGIFNFEIRRFLGLKKDC
jgi:hypothetical protein